MYQPKLEKDIRCPLEYGFGYFRRKMEIPYHLCFGRKTNSSVQRLTERNDEYYRCGLGLYLKRVDRRSNCKPAVLR